MQYDQVQPVQFQMAANRGRPTTALILGGQVVVENTRPALPTLLGRTRLQISRGARAPLFADIECPGLLVPGAGLLLGNPGRLVCPFRVPVGDGGAGGVQAQVSPSFLAGGGEVVSSVQPFNFAQAVEVELGRCASLRGDTPTGRGLAASRFRDGQRVQAPGNRVCQSVTFGYTQLVGTFPIDGGCGEYQVQQSIAVDPDGRFQRQQLSTAGARVRVVGCERPPALSFASARLFAQRRYAWKVSKAATPRGPLTTAWNKAVSISYDVRYDRALLGLGGFGVDTTIQVDNPNYFQLNLGYVQLEIAQGAQPAQLVRAKCPVDDQGRVVVPPRASVTCAASSASPAGEGVVALRAQAFQLDGAQVSSPVSRLDWADAAVNEVGRCAKISDTFSRSQADPLMEPNSVEGNAPPPAGQEQRVCNPAVFRYTATWGPWRRTDCSLTQPYNLATLTVEGTNQTFSDFSLASINITGCAPPARPLPIVRMTGVTSENITAEYRWSVTRALAPQVKSLTIAASGFSKVDVSVSYQRGNAVNVTKYLLKGFVVITNPQRAGTVEVERVEVVLSRGKGAPITVVPNCPSGGKKFLLQPSPNAGVTCGFSTPYPDNRASIAAAVVYLADKRNATSNVQPFTFAQAPNTTAGYCAYISDTFAWSAPAGVPAPKIGAGEKAPDAAQALRTCDPRTFKYTVQFGGFTRDKCSTFAFKSDARAVPTSGFGAAGASTLSLPVLCKP